MKLAVMILVKFNLTYVFAILLLNITMFNVELRHLMVFSENKSQDPRLKTIGTPCEQTIAVRAVCEQCIEIIVGFQNFFGITLEF